LSADPCIFCAIASGTAPASIVYADDIVLVFMDKGAINTGHLLIVPRRHVASLSDLDDETGARLFNVAARMGRAIRDLASSAKASISCSRTVKRPFKRSSMYICTSSHGSRATAFVSTPTGPLAQAEKNWMPRQH
jgi:hypothetical protein